MHILLTVSDDGRGIDTKKLADKAVQEGFLDTGQPEQMTEDDLLQLLFLQGYRQSTVWMTTPVAEWA